MNKNTIRLGIVGAGKNMVERHIPNFQTILDVEIVGVCNRWTSPLKLTLKRR